MDNPSILDSWVLERFIIGLRHKRTFSVVNKFGEFVDAIIPRQGRYPFPLNCFKKVGNPDRLSVEITDDEGILSVIYNTDGVILNCDMLADPPVDIETVGEMFTEIAHIAIPMTEGKNKVDRLGVIFVFSAVSSENSAKEIFSQHLKMDLKGTPDDVTIRFALKNPSTGALYMPDKKADYKNVIVQLMSERVQDEMDSTGNELKLPTGLKLTIDYQNYFIPVRTFKDIGIHSHISEAKEYISKHLKDKFEFEAAF